MATREEIDAAYAAHEAEMAAPKAEATMAKGPKQTPPLPAAVKLERAAAKYEQMLLANTIRAAQRKQSHHKRLAHKAR